MEERGAEREREALTTHFAEDARNLSQTAEQVNRKRKGKGGKRKKGKKRVQSRAKDHRLRHYTTPVKLPFVCIVRERGKKKKEGNDSQEHSLIIQKKG